MTLRQPPTIRRSSGSRLVIAGKSQEVWVRGIPPFAKGTRRMGHPHPHPVLFWKEKTKDVGPRAPSGAKARLIGALFGTAEAVPFHKTKSRFLPSVGMTTLKPGDKRRRFPVKSESLVLPI